MTGARVMLEGSILSEGMHGTSINQYQIGAALGAGGMGEVFRARDTRLDREVAIKVLPESFASDPDRLRRFELESKTLAALNHPNILTIHDAGVHEGAPYLVSELLDGQTLRELLGVACGTALPMRKAIDYALQIAQGLAAAHGKGITHRDLKPENIFIVKGGRVKILDFGLAKLRALHRESKISDPKSASESVDTLLQSTQPGLVLGTPAYMAPERVRGESVDHRADIFAFGCVLYEMLSGARAFRRDTPVQSMNAVLSEEPPELETVNAHLPLALSQVMRRCLEKSPENRFQSAKDLSFALEMIAGSSQKGEPIQAAAPLDAQGRGKLSLAIPVLCLCAFVGGAVTSRLRPGTHSSTAAASIRHMTYSGHDFSPSVTRDGKRICFRSDRDGTNGLWMKEMTSGTEDRWTSGSDDFPRFSPDGSAILFTRGFGAQTALYRVSAQIRGEVSRIVDNALAGDWSPGGKQITFVRWNTEKGSSVHIIQVDGSGERLLKAFPDQRGYCPRWSPDGKTIAMAINFVGAPQFIALINVGDGQTRTVPAPHPYNQLSSVTWEFNGRRLYCMQAESGSANSGGSTANLFRISPGGQFDKLLWSREHSRVLDWLPSGNILLDTRSSRENLKELPLGTNQASPRSLTFCNSTDRQPSYSPDGQEVFFSSNRSGNLEIWSINRSTRELHRRTDNPADDWDPGLCPNGKYFVWSSNRTADGRSGNLEIWIAESDGTAPKQLTHDGFAAENPTMTRDGRWVVYASTNPAKGGIWKVHPDGTGATLLVKAPFAGNAEISPDGRYVAYLEDNWGLHSSIKIIELESGAAVPFVIPILMIKETAAILGRCRWLPDSKAIAFLGQNAAGVNGIYIQDFAPDIDTSSTRRPLAGFDPEISAESFGISPDGEFITIASWEQFYNIMATQDLPVR